MAGLAVAQNTTLEATQCSKDVPCPEGSCCSWWGFCGTSETHCGVSCAYQCTDGHSADLKPGQEFSIDGSCNENRICPPGTCCSLWGWCGSTGLHCEGNNSTESPSPLPAVDDAQTLPANDTAADGELDAGDLQEGLDQDPAVEQPTSIPAITVPLTEAAPSPTVVNEEQAAAVVDDAAAGAANPTNPADPAAIAPVGADQGNGLTIPPATI
ncbi:hypothetical protein IWQ62_004193 [Dispira parvispora]|uniref:Chitin-binding type-1 domain-containing protein n=1 Tax=Dispira parvispora TaxID=1520584 RepID=A0A9W8ASX0_9FUNG|nr:hypothetical protein IWQ62_004193 [Dispira parvispora]